MGKFIEAVDALEMAKKASCATEEDIIKALEEARFNELIAETANKAGTSIRIGFKYPNILDTSKYFSAIKDYIRGLGYAIGYSYTSTEDITNHQYNYYDISWRK